MSRFNKSTIILALVTVYVTVANISMINSSDYNEPSVNLFEPSQRSVSPIFLLINGVLIVLLVRRFVSRTQASNIPKTTAKNEWANTSTPDPIKRRKNSGQKR